MKSDPLPVAPNPYCCQAGDTLAAIARRYGCSVQDLQRWNGIRDPRRIKIGQTLYLSEELAFGFRVHFLDALRHPIANLHFRLDFDGRARSGTTGPGGLTPLHIAKGPDSVINIWVRNLLGQWRRICCTSSGHGQKLITLVSDSIVLPAHTDSVSGDTPPVPSRKNTNNTGTKPSGASSHSPTGAPTKNNKAVTNKKERGPQGQPLITLGVRIPVGLMEYISHYTGAELTEEHWEEFATRLECEPEVLKAIAKVESGGRSAFWRLNEGKGAIAPAILFERHYFSKLTDGIYDKGHPDISWRTGYRPAKHIGKPDKMMHDGRIDQDDIYQGYRSSYLRLIKAYELSPAAALESCSWGKFQIMGANFKLCREQSIDDFVSRMCKSEADQIELLTAFIRDKPISKGKSVNPAERTMDLWAAVKTKNWRAIAFQYNGPSYETYSYHKKLEEAYAHYKKKQQG